MSQTQQVPVLPTLVQEMHLSSVLGVPAPFARQMPLLPVLGWP
jgi:hypothetical protein